MSEAPPSYSTLQMELEKQEALKRTEALMRLKQRLEAGILPDKDEIVSMINAANVEIDTMKTDVRISPLGKQILDHASDVLDSLKALVKEREGLARNLVELSRETVLALQESAAELGRVASQLTTQVSQGVQHAGQVLESKLNEKAPEIKQEAAKRVRSASERLLFVVRRLAGSAEGHRLSAELATFLRRLLQITGETMERAARQTKQAGEGAPGKEGQREFKREKRGAASSVESKQAPTMTGPGSAAASSIPSAVSASQATPQAHGIGIEPDHASLVRQRIAEMEAHAHQTGAGAAEPFKPEPEHHPQQAPQHHPQARQTQQPQVQPQPQQPQQSIDKDKDKIEREIEQTAREIRDVHLEPIKQALPSEQQVKDIKRTIEEGAEQLKRQAEEHVETIPDLARRLLRRAIDHDELRDALRELLEMFREIGQTVEKAVEQVASQLGAPSGSLLGSGMPPRVSNHAEKAAQAAEAVLRQLAGDSFDRLRAKVRQLGESVQRDQKLADYFKDLSTMLQQALDDPRVIDNDMYREHFNKLLDHGSNLFGQKEHEVRGLLDEIGSLLDGIVNTIVHDEHIKDLQQAVCKLYEDLTEKDAQGRMHLKDEAMRQLKLVLAPALARRLRLLALPPITHEDENYYLRLEDLVLHTAEIPPELLQAHLESDMAIDLRTMRASALQGKLTIALRNLELHAPNVRFHFHKKTFPKLTDEGHVDLDAKGVNLILEFEQQAKQPYLSRARATCTMADFAITVKNDADHQVLLQWYTSFYKGRMGSALAEAIVNSLQNFGDTLADLLNRAVDLAWTVAAPAGSMIEAVTGYSASSAPSQAQQHEGVKLSVTAGTSESFAFSKTTTTIEAGQPQLQHPSSLASSSSASGPALSSPAGVPHASHAQTGRAQPFRKAQR